MLLPALAAWAVETDRALVWWIVAAGAQLFGNGALFVTPLCAVATAATVWQRRGVAAAVRASAPGLVWAAVFAINYFVVLRPAHTSEFLQSYWQLQCPPAAGGAIALAKWIGAKLAPSGGTRPPPRRPSSKSGTTILDRVPPRRPRPRPRRRVARSGLHGFHFDDVPKSFDALLLERMMGIGQMTAYRGFDDVSRAAIVDRRLTSRRERADQVPGCITARPARRW